jgi:general nucleoside transport system permease protein
MNAALPKWVDFGLIPILNVVLAFVVSGLVVAFIGENPFQAMKLMIIGSLGSGYAIGFTLFYATSFIFTGVAVAMAFHASQFNIGGEGQAGVAGLGVTFVCLSLDQTHWLLTLPLAVAAGALFGAIWAGIPAYLQVRRGSHVVITTIMFNFIASALLVYTLVNVLKVDGSMAPESRKFAQGAHIPYIHDILGGLGIDMSRTPLNVAFFLALAVLVGMYYLIWRTNLGYEIRAFGQSEPAAEYAGISSFKIVIVVMLISGGAAGLMAVNTVMGAKHQLVLDAVRGAGFVGIAVALIGRAHPIGIFFAAVLFGMLYQGGAELAFEMPAITRDMIVVIQSLVIMFTGALENLIRIPISRFFEAASLRQEYK